MNVGPMQKNSVLHRASGLKDSSECPDKPGGPQLLTEEEFIEEERKLGRKLHEHDGVWWVQRRPFYCKPVLEFRAFPRGSARPGLGRSFLGYSHQVLNPGEGNRMLEFMILDGEDLRLFSLEKLKSEKRTRVRKGLKACEVRLITDIEPYLETIRLINISQAQRHSRTDVPPSYYTDHIDKWRREMRAGHAHRGMKWWGAFKGDQLLGYLVTVGVEETLYISAVKTDSEHMKSCPSDALHCTVLESAAVDERCARIVHGGPANEGLDRYKELFLFRKVAISYFTAGRALYSVARSVFNIREKALSWLKA